jgi:phosphatidylinositol-3-phosphatase
MKPSLVLAAVGTALALALAGCASSAPSGAAPASVSPTPPVSVNPSATTSVPPATRVPQPAHTVVVVLENHGYGQVIGNSDAPFLNQLASRGALFTHSYAITHPSEPNYLALFSGSTQGVTSDACPVTFTAPNLAAGLLAARKTFAGYAEGLPGVGSTVCTDGEYARKHVPWADFRNVPASLNRPFSGFPATDFASLPTVSFVIPNLCNDMHDCSVATGDSWLRAHLGSYATWAMTHDSLLVVTFDEDDGGGANQITTIFLGQNVRPGRYPDRITHYTVLATMEAAYGLARDGAAASTAPITDIWHS